MRISDWSSDVCSSDLQYRKARRALLNYNSRLAQDKAIFERRGDNLQATLERIALDIGSSSAALDSRIREGSHLWIDRSEEHTSELQSLMRHSYAVFCLKNRKKNKKN